VTFAHGLRHRNDRGRAGTEGIGLRLVPDRARESLRFDRSRLRLPPLPCLPPGFATDRGLGSRPPLHIPADRELALKSDAPVGR
jgi:hypothetical protein